MVTGLTSTKRFTREEHLAVSPLLFRILAIAFPLQWGSKYSRLDRSPHFLEYIFLRRRIRLKAVFGFGGSDTTNASPKPVSPGEIRLYRRYLAFSVPPLGVPEEKEALPAIRLLWVAHPKDFPVLTHSLESALHHTRNPVTSIAVVSPEPAQARETLNPIIPAGIVVDFPHDNDYVPQEIRSRLNQALPSHGSWATQQLIKVFASLEYSSQPTLVIDADTILLHDKIWLYSDGSQLLYFRGFYNERYANFLRYWGFNDIDILRSFVTHHMLFQPGILQEVTTSVFGSLELGRIVDIVTSSAKALGYPEFCLEYEPYGQFMSGRYRDRVKFDKYSNLGLPRPIDEHELDKTIKRLRQQGLFNSVSFHKPDR